MAGEYEVHQDFRDWSHVKHRKDGHDALYCHWCRKVTPYTIGSKPDKCPMCEHPYGYQREVPTPRTSHLGEEPINPKTGRGEYSGDKYEMEYDWDRGYLWKPFVGMK